MPSSVCGRCTYLYYLSAFRAGRCAVRRGQRAGNGGHLRSQHFCGKIYGWNYCLNKTCT
nr:MAG TPA: hypothetical protein [Caudoviricetes sp.]